jgi:hypothetical protein
MMKHHESLSASTRSEDDVEKTVFRLVVASVLLYVLQSRNVASREERARDRGRASHRNGARFLFRALFDVECLVSRSRRERAIERLGYQRRSTLAETRGHGRARHLIRSRNAFATTSVVAPKEWRQRAFVRASRRSLSIDPLQHERRLPASAAHLRRAVVEPVDAGSAVHVSAGAASAASAPRTPSASAQASAGDAAEPSPALFPLLRAVRLRVLGVDHGLEAVSSRRVRGERDGEERETGVSATKRSRGDEDAGEIWGRGEGGHAQRGDEVHDAPEDVGDYAQPVRRAAAHDRAVAHVRHGSCRSLVRAARLQL